MTKESKIHLNMANMERNY